MHNLHLDKQMCTPLMSGSASASTTLGLPLPFPAAPARRLAPHRLRPSMSTAAQNGKRQRNRLQYRAAKSVDTIQRAGRQHGLPGCFHLRPLANANKLFNRLRPCPCSQPAHLPTPAPPPSRLFLSPPACKPILMLASRPLFSSTICSSSGYVVMSVGSRSHLHAHVHIRICAYASQPSCYSRLCCFAAQKNIKVIRY